MSKSEFDLGLIPVREKKPLLSKFWRSPPFTKTSIKSLFPFDIS